MCRCVQFRTQIDPIRSVSHPSKSTMARTPIAPIDSATGLSRSDHGVILPLWITSFHNGTKGERIWRRSLYNDYNSVTEPFAGRQCG